MTAVVILAPHLRQDNAPELLSEAGGLRTRAVEALVARLAPRPDYPDMLRALPASATAPTTAPAPTQTFPAAVESGSVPAAPRLSGAGIEPLSAERHLFRFTGSNEFRAKYERAKDLLLSSRAGKTMEAVIEAGLDALLDRLDPERRIARRKSKAARRIPLRASSRKIPLVLRDAVWSRDGGRCVFIGPDGGRCPATTGLEIDHIRPYALGGPSDDPANLRVMCRAHNQLLARRVFGGAAGPRART